MGIEGFHHLDTFLTRGKFDPKRVAVIGETIQAHQPSRDREKWSRWTCSCGEVSRKGLSHEIHLAIVLAESLHGMYPEMIERWRERDEGGVL